jgi:hypothetical protein
MAQDRRAWDEHLADPHLPRRLGRLLADAGFTVARPHVHPAPGTTGQPTLARSNRTSKLQPSQERAGICCRAQVLPSGSVNLTNRPHG